MSRRFLLAALTGAALMAPALVQAQAPAPTSAPAPAAARPGLFVNLTTDDAWAASKAIFFAHQRVLRAGHRPVSIWLNVRGVYLADRRRASARISPQVADIQAMLRAFIADGGQVIACQACMGVAGLTAADLIDGVVVGTPEVLMPALMGPDIRSLLW
jgi:sulfur relay (sulfurtransferase) complex TusBCD TusD component (DsrE family)